MDRARRGAAELTVHVEEGVLPPLDLDWTKPAELLYRAAAQFARNGVLSEMMVETECDIGQATIPMVCGFGDEEWVPYIEGDPWDEAVTERFLDWLYLVRQSSHADVRLQFYSRHEVPHIVRTLARTNGFARLQLDALHLYVPHAFNDNAELLRSLVKQHLRNELRLDSDSVKVLDDLITRHLGDAPPLLVTQALVHLVGCFLGQVIVRTHQGLWKQVGEQWLIEPTGMAPLDVAVDRFARGSRAPLFMRLPG